MSNDGSSVYFIVDNSGNVGIGTTVPTSKLDVVGGTIRGNSGLTISSGSVSLPSGSISNASLANSSVTINNGTNVTGGGTVSLGGSLTLGTSANPSFSTSVTTPLVQNNSADLTLQTNTAGHVLLSPAGNVGIGTTNPNYFTVVQKDDGVTSGEHLLFNTRRAAASGEILLGYRADGTNVTSTLVRSGNSAPLTLGTTTTNQAVTILDNGNVGIGSAAPGTKLDVSGTIKGSNGLTISAGTITLPTGSIDSTDILDGTVSSTDIADGTIVNADISSSAAIAGTKISPNFGSQNISTTGILTTTGELAMNASAATDRSILRMRNGVSGDSQWYQVARSDGTLNWFYYDGAAWHNGLGLTSAWDTTVYNDLHVSGAGPHYFSAGNVGIGTTSPSKLLYVNGSMTVNSADVNFPVLSSGTGTTAVIGAAGNLKLSSSSLRYKKDVKDYSTDFDRIMDASPKSFTYKDDNNKDIGYIAEDFEALGLNDLLIYDKQGRPDAIKYDKIPLYLIEIMKKQQAQNEQQQKEIEELKTTIEKLKK